MSDWSDKGLVGEAYLGLLGRQPDKRGQLAYIAAMKSGRSLASILESMVKSEEFQARYGRVLAQREDLDQMIHMLAAGIFPSRLHQLRQQLVARLPAAQNILDLGGASGSSEIGALLQMGYPHKPQTLDIIDLPPADRLLPAAEMNRELTHGRTRIRYHYRSMHELVDFEDQSFDLIWSGETIEHIPPEHAEEVFSHAARLLRPGGYLALDTPNRALTRLEVGDEAFIHPEHKHEYEYQEFIDRFAMPELEIVRSLGLIHMPRSLRSGSFRYVEALLQVPLNRVPEQSYAFFVLYQRA